MQIIRPIAWVSHYSKQYPTAWQQVDAYREMGKGEWPNWCYLPSEYFEELVREQKKKQGALSSALVNDAVMLQSLATWRVTQGIYRFDADIYERIIATEHQGKLPTQVFFNLSEWCIYIETPNMMIDEKKVYGVFVLLDIAPTGKATLSIATDQEDGYRIYGIYIDEGSIEEGFDKQNYDAWQATSCHTHNDYNHEEYVTRCVPQLKPIISLVLYLCAQNADFGGTKPQKPQPIKTKRGWRLFPPNKPTVWDIGFRVGTMLRQYHAHSDHQSQGKGNSPRPHIRKGHWHGYWFGSISKPAERRFELKWLLPTLVGGSEIIPTVYPVKKEKEAVGF